MRQKRLSVRFLNLVEDARLRITEITVDEVLSRRNRGKTLQLLDVREDREWLQSHISGARHLSRGTIERDIELYYRDLDEELILYCEDGLRSALSADLLEKMGYGKVRSMAGGFCAWKAAGGSIGL